VLQHKFLSWAVAAGEEITKEEVAVQVLLFITQISQYHRGHIL
jgi:hypothetical protein